MKNTAGSLVVATQNSEAWDKIWDDCLKEIVKIGQEAEACLLDLPNSSERLFNHIHKFLTTLARNLKSMANNFIQIILDAVEYFVSITVGKALNVFGSYEISKDLLRDAVNAVCNVSEKIINYLTDYSSHISVGGDISNSSVKEITHPVITYTAKQQQSIPSSSSQSSSSSSSSVAMSSSSTNSFASQLRPSLEAVTSIGNRSYILFLKRKINTEEIRLQINFGSSYSSYWIASAFYISQGYSHQLKLHALRALKEEINQSDVQSKFRCSHQTRKILEEAYTYWPKEEDRSFKTNFIDKNFLKYDDQNLKIQNGTKTRISFCQQLQLLLALPE